MSLSARIMNLREPDYDGTDAYTHRCKGYRQARHAAAELAAEADAIRDELVAALDAVVANSNGSRGGGYADIPWPTVENARAALARARLQK